MSGGHGRIAGNQFKKLKHMEKQKDYIPPVVLARVTIDPEGILCISGSLVKNVSVDVAEYEQEKFEW